jgi:TRAP-type transport system periplasmic protein
MNKRYLLGLVFLFVVFSIFSFCPFAVDAQPKAPKYQAALTVPAGQQKVTIKSQTDVGMEINFWGPLMQQFADRVKGLSGETLIIEVYPAVGLGFPSAQIFLPLRDGRLKLAQACTAYTAGTWYNGDIINLPLFYNQNFKDGMAPLFATKEMEPVLGKDLLEKFNCKLLWITTTEPQELCLKSEVKTAADLKGKKIRASGKMQEQLFAVSSPSIGWSGLTLPFGDVYTALQQGTIDGYITPTSVNYNSKMYEVCPYVYRVPINVGGFVIYAMNNSFYESLSQFHKDVITQAVRETEFLTPGSLTYGIWLGEAVSRKAGVKVNDLPKSIMKELAEPARKIWKDFLDKGDAVTKQLYDIAAKYSE